MKKPVVHLYTACWDEADMLGFFFRHYDPWVDRYVVYDDGSTDGSLEILRAHPKVELRSLVRVNADSFVLSQAAMQNEAWKESRGCADWVVVTAIDEHLLVRDRTMATYLAEQRKCDTTIIPALGFDMNNPVMPENHGLLHEIVTRGRPRIAFSKLSVFNPDAVTETGFTVGRHTARPVGDLKLPARDEVMLWHYKHLGFERNAEREAAQARRLGPVDVANGTGQHYLWSMEQRRAFWNEMERETTDLARSDFDPARACVGPLWWNERPEMARPSRPLRMQTNSTPTVSVLIKSYNHAPYVRQTIESVLSQSFQDFEIITTDDGSTDDTPRILRSFDDPHLRLELWSENQGISAAMNATIARARGRYLAILNSDDWALPDRLQKQVTFLDSNPDVSAVFGLPYPVDDSNEPTVAFNDFSIPLQLPDYSRRSWLRHFFFCGNCLCAPTAMIRREVYDEVGRYDLRLTNLQDFDMWIRMLIAGHNIHVLPEELTAFRIRAGNANMSAARTDTWLRTAFETAKILRHFTEMDPKVFDEVFGEDPRNSCPGDRSVPWRVAELAKTVQPYFALELFHENAQMSGDFRYLRELTGSMDVFGQVAIGERDQAIGEAAKRQLSLEQALQDAQRALEASAIEIRQIDEARTALANKMRQLETSISWRATAPLRKSLSWLVTHSATGSRYASVARTLASQSRWIRRQQEHFRLRRQARYLSKSGLFDARWYLEAYPDVRMAGVNPLMHYLQHGAAEGRDPGPLFDSQSYLRRYPDVQRAGINPLVHYLRHGATEGRSASPVFDSE